MKGFKFVRVYESGAEEDIPQPLVAQAFQAAEGGGVFVSGRMGPQGQRRDPAKPPSLYASPSVVMAVIQYLSNLPQYRGARIDAIEVGLSH